MLLGVLLPSAQATYARMCVGGQPWLQVSCVFSLVGVSEMMMKN